jgi:hypothetical protein
VALTDCSIHDDQVPRGVHVGGPDGYGGWVDTGWVKKIMYLAEMLPKL